MRLGKYKPTSQLYILIKDHHTGLIINAHQHTHRNKTFYKEQASLKATNYTHISMQQVGLCVWEGGYLPCSEGTTMKIKVMEIYYMVLDAKTST